MKRFKFRLEKVLEYRQGIKAEKKRELLLKNHELRMAEERLTELEASLAGSGTQGAGVMDAQIFLLSGAYRARLKGEIEKQLAVIEEKKKEVQEAHGRYIEASKEEKALSLLKERKHREYTEYVQREEDKFLDELSTQKGNTLHRKEPYE